eukprot:CAMPEP_0182571344 /NCGR_PEP_ID=MMETSP1324-20130603/13244_1 /TAXON_ID=236786 /ORGANISM="Florenciella sp., Strain RCC1587" /LENGTH=110 /DNA_ID=CAMNT_0024785927 /DNA_START=504 /DNA_END=836 /DNA_ORIENTATION=+
MHAFKDPIFDAGISEHVQEPGLEPHSAWVMGPGTPLPIVREPAITLRVARDQVRDDKFDMRPPPAIRAWGGLPPLADDLAHHQSGNRRQGVRRRGLRHGVPGTESDADNA